MVWSGIHRRPAFSNHEDTRQMKMPGLSPARLRHALQCAAKCDAIAMSEDWSRTFWYHENWADGIAMAKYDNGGGDHVIVLFTSDGKALIKGFDHESEASPYAREAYATWPGMYDGMPPAFSALLRDEAVEHVDATFCCWSADGETWQTGTAVIPDDIDDGSTWLLDMVQMNAEDFIGWAKDYYGDEFDVLGESRVVAIFKDGASHNA
jgi:hypothetical protein